MAASTIADTERANCTLETSHSPTYCLQPDDVPMEAFAPGRRVRLCESKGHARCFDVVVDGERLPNAAWSCPAPSANFAALRDHLAFYAGPFDA